MTDFESLKTLLDASRAALLDPASDPVVALFSLAVVVIVLLLLVLGGYFLLLTPERKLEGTAAPDDAAQVAGEKKPPNPRGRIVGATLTILAVAALSYAWTYSGLDRSCTKCHFTERAVESHADGTHASVSCRDCHIGPGASSAVMARLQGIQNAAVQMTGRASDTPVSARVANSACLSCHGDVVETVVVARSIRIRHADLVEIGRACIDCHNTEGHGRDVRRALYPKMSDCLACHDGTRASSECDTCHSEDVGVAVRRLQRPLPQENVEKEDCRGCHSMQPCIECHGLELPHSKEFMNGFHARKALLEPNVCRQCHSTEVFCNGCHRFTVSPNAALPWKRKHANMGDFVTWHASTSTSGLGSCRCHDTDRERFCNYCHGPQPER